MRDDQEGHGQPWESFPECEQLMPTRVGTPWFPSDEEGLGNHSHRIIGSKAQPCKCYDQKIHALEYLTRSPLPLQALLAQLESILTCLHFLHIMT